MTFDSILRDITSNLAREVSGSRLIDKEFKRIQIPLPPIEEQNKNKNPNPPRFGEIGRYNENN